MEPHSSGAALPAGLPAALNGMACAVILAGSAGPVFLNPLAAGALGLPARASSPRLSRRFPSILREDGSLLAPAGPPAARALTRLRPRNGFTVGFEPPGGAVRWVHGSLTRWPSAAPGPRLTLISFVEITGRRLAEAALRQSEGRYRTVIDAAAEGIWVVDDRFRTIFANPHMTRLLGCSLQDLKERPVGHFLTDGERLPPPADRSLPRSSSPWETWLHCADGTDRWVRVAICPLGGLDGQGGASLLVVADRTEHKRLEDAGRRAAEIEAANRRMTSNVAARERFFASLSHELRSPLNAIGGVAELLDKGSFGALASRQKEMIGRLRASTNHLLELVNSILDLAQVEANQVDFTPTLTSLAALVEQTVAVLSPGAQAAGVTIEHHVDGAIGAAYLDPLRLRQVLYNFLSNAIKATSAGGSITVRLLPDGPSCFRLEVADKGPGVPPEDMLRLFHEFERLPGARGSVARGSGLGLVITRRIVEAQGGSVGVSSRLGEGSVFWAVLPLRTAPPGATA